ncbi:hypothetical protein Hdeb2414_s0209g00833101 [Helianthus debilis subsp. tardiflorus]
MISSSLFYYIISCLLVSSPKVELITFMSNTKNAYHQSITYNIYMYLWLRPNPPA